MNLHKNLKKFLTESIEVDLIFITIFAYDMYVAR